MIPDQAIRPLPARAVPLPGESLESLLRRTAEAMGYEGPGRVQSLISEDEDLPGNVNLLSQGPALDRLAGLLHRPAADLWAMSVHALAAELVLVSRGSPRPAVCDSKTILKYFVSGASPVCPACLKEGPVPFERLLWSFRPLPICLPHRSVLISQCPAFCSGRRHTWTSSVIPHLLMPCGTICLRTMPWGT